MSALAEVTSSDSPGHARRERKFPTCAACADSVIAAEASAFVTEDEICHLWICENCGYGFITKHSTKGCN